VESAFRVSPAAAAGELDRSLAGNPIHMLMRVRKWLFVTAVAFGLLYAIWAVVCHNVHASFVYVVEARFEKMPPDDKALIEWLRSQPGIVSHTVAIGRFEDGKLLYILFIQSRSLSGRPPFPDLNGNVGRLGYMESDGPFRDAEDRSRTITMEN
jgi:hypothetical protein